MFDILNFSNSNSNLLDNKIEWICKTFANLEELDVSSSHIIGPIFNLPKLKNLHLVNCFQLEELVKFNCPSLKLIQIPTSFDRYQQKKEKE